MYRALERRTHPCTYASDMIEPFHYPENEVEVQRREGHRPSIHAIISTWWTHDTATDQCWRWESRTWDLPSLIHIYSYRYSLKYIYSLWCSLPLAIGGKQRGKDAPARITIPLSALKEFPDVYQKLVGQIPQSAMVEVKVNWRCNVLHSWCLWPCGGLCNTEGR